MSTEFRYAVFLSHNSADKPRVRRLAERLRAARRRVSFDEWICPSPAGAAEGGPRPGEGRGAKRASPRPSDGRARRGEAMTIERGLEASRTLVLCLSPAALGWAWAGLERSTVLFRDPAIAGRRFIPVLLADCTLPDTLRHQALHQRMFRQGRHVRPKRRAAFQPRKTFPMRRVPMTLRLRFARKHRPPPARVLYRNRATALGGQPTGRITGAACHCPLSKTA
mgnify:CR=1 FL=1